MKRWLIRIILCLILGAITTVAVAWGFFTRTSPVAQRIVVIPRTTTGSMLRIEAASRGAQEEFNWDTAWFYLWDTPFARESHGAVVFTAPRFDEVQIDLIKQAYEWVAANDGVPSDWIFSEGGEWYSRDRRAGWPLMALSLHEQHKYIAGGLIDSSTNGVILPSGLANRLHRWAIPIVPIWPGFLIDTLFYAAIWFGVFFGFASAKRAIRRRRGRCPRCGYDLRGQGAEVSGQKSEVSGARAGCPECGWNRPDAHQVGASRFT